MQEKSESKADMMFEELGYYKNNKHDMYTKYKGSDILRVFRFTKFREHKRVQLTGNQVIGLGEIKAINEKLKELGWLDE